MSLTKFHWVRFFISDALFWIQDATPQPGLGTRALSHTEAAD